MGKKKSSGTGIVASAVIGFIALLALLPLAAWIAIGAACVIAGAILLFAGRTQPAESPVRQPSSAQGSSRPTAPSKPPSPRPRDAIGAPARETPKVATQDLRRRMSVDPQRRKLGHSETVVPTRAQSASTPAQETAFGIPPAPQGIGPGRWIDKDETVDVAGIKIPGGMFYLGTSLPTRPGAVDPCLVDPTKPIARQANFTVRETAYWPSYSEVSSVARRAYLEWLLDGRRHPGADIGYVFMFFYGLERRAIVEAKNDTQARADLPIIAQELRELLAVYGEKSGPFRNYANGLLNWVEFARYPRKLYEKPIPVLARSFELPFHVRLALGQAAIDKVPVPGRLALAWIQYLPDSPPKTPAIRCPNQFERLFLEKYERTFGPGIVLPLTKTKLKLVYRPASSAFNGSDGLSLSFGDLPDASVLVGTFKNLLTLVDAVTTELGPYSRYVGRNAAGAASLEAVIHLPTSLWPASSLRSMQALKTRIGEGMIALSFQELLSSFDATGVPTKEKLHALARALESTDVGMEPDVLSGAKSPKPEDAVVLFAVPAASSSSRKDTGYQVAVLTLQLSAAVASADGSFNAEEMSHLRHQIQSWTHIPEDLQRRLLAQLQILLNTPVSIASLKKRLDPLEQPTKHTIASFMASVAQADGAVTPTELKTLEKIYKLLGVDVKQMFSDVHSASTGEASSLPQNKGPTEFKLDAARIASLQRDSDKVSALLADIFEDEVLPLVATTPESTEDEVEGPCGLLGLDDAHSALARILLSRPEWTRSELNDVAADLDLMLDGALEQVNEACFDRFDLSLTDGDDPITLNVEILEKIEA